MVTKVRSLVAALMLAAIFAPIFVYADAAGHMVISEIQTGTDAVAAQEFVELYNPTDQAVNLSGWSLQYKSATSTDHASSWTKRANLTGTVGAHGFYLAAPKDYLSAADADWSATLAGSGGHVRLVDGTGTVIDRVGYGDANAAETKPATAPPAGQSLERLPGRLIEDGGNATDSDDNSADFILRSNPQPQSTTAPAELPSTADPAPAPDPGPDPGTSPSGLIVQITELLPNPAAPLSDTQDEFIELYNPNDLAINLAGYELRTGSNFHDHFTLPALTLNPGAYLALTSAQTKLTLPNAGGAAQLLDPAGQVVDTTPSYPMAAAGQSWALGADGWTWTIQPTPGSPNQLVAPVLAGTTAAKSSAAPKSSATKTTAPKTSTAKSTTAGNAKSASAKPTTAAVKPVVSVEHPGSAIWLIAGLGVLTLGYALYEFRPDLRNLLHFARRQSGPRP